jgi:ABC-2 type transport system ATP-binding protein
MHDTVLDVSHLSKVYGSMRAVSDVSITVARGEVVGLLGPNGAGKTSTISMLLGVLTPTSGTITVGGFDIAQQRSEAMKLVNFAAVYAQLPGNLTVGENLRFFGRLYDVPELEARVADVLSMLDIQKFVNTRTGFLSSGEQTRVVLAKALLTRPSLLLLDEPTASLDPATAHDIRALISDYAKKGNGILWTSHNMQEVTEVCSRVIFLSHGTILLEGDPKTLPQEHGMRDLEALFISVAREPLALDI